MFGKIIIRSGIFVPLAMLLAGPGPAFQESSQTTKAAPRLIELSQDRIYRLELRVPGERTLLQRWGDAWVLPEWQNHPADKTYVAMLLGTLCNLPKGVAVTENREDYAHYGLGDDAKTVIARDEKGYALFSLRVGNRGETYRAAYVLLEGQPEVRLLDADLIPAVSRITWGDRTVWRLPESLIREIYFKGFEHDFHVKKIDGSWLVVEPEGVPLDKRFPQLLRQMAFMRAGNLAFRPNPRAGFRTERTVNVVTDMLTLTLELGPVEGAAVPGRRGDAPVHYLFSPYFLDWLNSFVAPVETHPNP